MIKQLVYPTLACLILACAEPPAQVLNQEQSKAQKTTAYRGANSKTFNVKCLIADPTNRNQVEVPLTLGHGEQVVEDVVFSYRGHKIIARYDSGDVFYSTHRMSMVVDGIATGLQDVTPNTLLTMNGPDYFFQCAVINP